MFEIRAEFLARRTQQETKGKPQLKSATESGKQGPILPLVPIKHSRGYLATNTSDQMQMSLLKNRDVKVLYHSLNMKNG